MDRNNESRLVFEADPVLTYMEKGNGEDRTSRIPRNSCGPFICRLDHTGYGVSCLYLAVLNRRQFSSKFLSGVCENFGQGGVVMRDAEKIVDCAVKVHDGNQFMDEFRGFWSDDVTTENLT